MKTGKKEISTAKTDVKKGKKSRTRKLIYWLLIDLSVAIIVLALLLYRPGWYRPGQYRPTELEPDGGSQVSTYLTNELAPQVYNKSQLGRAFDVVITQDGLNDIIRCANWPIESEGVLLYDPVAVLVTGTIVLMLTVDMQGVEFIVTIELKPEIDEQKLLNLQLAAVKVGAVNLTPFAKTIAKKIYDERLAAFPIDTSAWQTKIAASLFNKEPFEPAFSIEGKSLRIEKISIENGQIIAQLVPYRRGGQ